MSAEERADRLMREYATVQRRRFRRAIAGCTRLNRLATVILSRLEDGMERDLAKEVKELRTEVDRLKRELGDVDGGMYAAVDRLKAERSVKEAVPAPSTELFALPRFLELQPEIGEHVAAVSVDHIVGIEPVTRSSAEGPQQRCVLSLSNGKTSIARCSWNEFWTLLEGASSRMKKG